MTAKRTAKRAATLGLLVVVTTLASACSWDFRRGLGLVGPGPDETQVVLNRPLQVPETLPETVEQLPPPQPGAESRVAPTPLVDAQVALQGQVAPQPTESSEAEQALLDAAGAGSGDGQIRRRIEEDAAAAQEGSRLLDGVFGRDEEVEGTPLDPAAEAERIAQERRRRLQEQGLAPPPSEQ